jgi:hypothetical protein
VAKGCSIDSGQRIQRKRSPRKPREGENEEAYAGDASRNRIAVSYFELNKRYWTCTNAIAGREEIGKWVDKTLHVGATYTIYAEDGDFYLWHDLIDRSGGKQLLTESSTPTGLARYDLVDDPSGIYFVIDETGSLEMYDSTGLIVVLHPLKQED